MAHIRLLALLIASIATSGCIDDQSTGVATATKIVASYRVGGTISGLTTSGLTLANGGDVVAVAAGATSFTLPTEVAAGAAFSISVRSQPAGQTCLVNQGATTMGSADVNTIQVSCGTNSYSLGGIITGLTAAGLVVANGTDSVTVAAASSAFVLPSAVASGAGYSVSISTQPASLTCQVINGGGTVTAASVTNIIIACGQWTWISGSSQNSAAGAFGTLGSAAADNVPGARSGASSWLDRNGNLWLFGGASTAGNLNDLWKYDVSAAVWTWLGGSQNPNASGVYGTLGMPGAANMPGARSGAASWTDAGGQLWLFGGQGEDAAGAVGALNDLWQYDTIAGQWRWISGANSAWSATATPPSTAPGGRSGAIGWSDTSGHAWIFGGASPQGLTNDLWQFTPANGQWLLLSGSQSSVNSNGVYGSIGVAGGTNLPGSRTQAAAAVDSSGTLWLFGGSGYGVIGGLGLLNDLWSFNPASSQWTWVAGFRTVNAEGVYGTRSTTDVKAPGARSAASAMFDLSGNFSLIGGQGYDGAGHRGELNDLWTFDPGSKQWIWMSGAQISGAKGLYGMQGVAARDSSPGARSASNAWRDAAGNLWLFGGQGVDAGSSTGTLNDLWEFVP